MMTLARDHAAVLIHGITGQELMDCTLPAGLSVRVEAICGGVAWVIASDDLCRYRVSLDEVKKEQSL